MLPITETTLRTQFYQINKNILLVFMQQNSFLVPTKHFATLIEFWLLKQNVLSGQQNFFSGQQKKFCHIHFFLSVRYRLLGHLPLTIIEKVT